MGFVTDRVYAGISRREFTDPNEPGCFYTVSKVVHTPATAAWAALNYPGGCEFCRKDGWMVHGCVGLLWCGTTWRAASGWYSLRARLASYCKVVWLRGCSHCSIRRPVSIVGHLRQACALFLAQTAAHLPYKHQVLVLSTSVPPCTMLMLPLLLSPLTLGKLSLLL